jgi:beta-lactamase class A
MALLLQRLATGHLLSPASTRFILQTMTQTATFPNRLKAGVPAGWLCMHKTGTSGSWRGVTAATNDVAILKAPDGSFLSIAVFVADTKVESEIRANLMRDLASATVADFR